MAVVDYSAQIIAVKHLVKDIESLLAKKEWDRASMLIFDAIYEMRLMNANISLLKENGGTPYQS
jgi:hypothetical protein